MSIPDLAIREIRARPVVVPLPRPIRTASGDVLDAPLLLVDVLTDAGVMGRAYAFAYTQLTLRSLAQFLRDIAPELVGKSVSPRARMRQLEKRLKLVGWQGFAGMVVGTLDMALWDALARAMDVAGAERVQHGPTAETSQEHTQSVAARPPDNGWPLVSARARPYVRMVSALRETRGVVVVRCLRCGHDGSLSRTALARFGLDPNAPIVAYVKRLRCSKCGSSSVMAKRTTQPNTEQDRRKRRA
jgi:hypothetical protein